MFFAVALGVAAAVVVDCNKAAICLSLSKLRFDQESAFVSQSVETPGLSYESIFAKLVTSATLHCYAHISADDFTEALDTLNVSKLHPRMKDLTPFPDEFLCAEDDAYVTEEERTKFVQLVEVVKAEYRRTDNSGMQYR